MTLDESVHGLTARPAGAPGIHPPEVERLVLGIAISAATWAAAGSPPTWLGPGTCAWRPAPPAVAAPGRAGDAPRSADRARAAGRPHGGIADGADPASPLARASRPHAACRGERAS